MYERLADRKILKSIKQYITKQNKQITFTAYLLSQYIVLFIYEKKLYFRESSELKKYCFTNSIKH